MATSNKQEPPAQYDFIIVGSGAGGGPLACNLARKGFRVLLLEAGGWDSPEELDVPAFHPHATEHPDLSWEFFVKHYGDKTQSVSDSKWNKAKEGIFYPRSASVGGCTIHNALITLCGPPDDWDEIAGITGDRSWAGQKMRSYFERLEHCDYLPRPGSHRQTLYRTLRNKLNEALGLPSAANAGRHGFDGWFHTTVTDPKLVLKDSQLLGQILAAIIETEISGLEDIKDLLKEFLTGEISEHLDPNHWETLQGRPEGIALIPLAVYHGRRNGIRDFLHDTLQKHKDRLTVQTETLVTQLLFAPPTDPPGPPNAVGVRYLRGKHLYKAHPKPQAGGVPGEAYCRREVILCGGAYNSPQLLKLSGVGPAEELSRFNIPVRVDLPGVGMNLQDRYEIGIISQMTRDFPILKGLTLAEPKPGEEPDKALVEWREKKAGLYTTNGAVLGIVKKSRPDLCDPDLFLFGMPGYFKGYYTGYSKDIAKQHDYFTWAILKAHTKNRAGKVTLRSANPLDMPEINFHYFQEGTDLEEDDLTAMVEGVRFALKINQCGGKIHLVNKPVWPPSDISDTAAIRDFVRKEAWGHHASCTCAIGSDGDPMAVLDSRFRVRGVRNLRVVDASVFPKIPGMFLTMSIHMAAEKASDVIAADNARTEPIS